MKNTKEKQEVSEVLTPRMRFINAFYETGLHGELELHNWSVECGNHTFGCEEIECAIKVKLNEITVITCPVCGKQGKVQLLAEGVATKRCNRTAVVLD